MIKYRRHLRSIRKSNAIAIVEIVFGAILMIAIAGLALDVTVLLMAASLNDSACRDAVAGSRFDRDGQSR